MKLKFYLEKLHKNEIYEEDDIDYIKNFIKDNTKLAYKTQSDFENIFPTIDKFFDTFTQKQLKKINQYINLKKIIRYTYFIVFDLKEINKKIIFKNYNDQKFIVGKYFRYKDRLIYPYFEIKNTHI